MNEIVHVSVPRLSDERYLLRENWTLSESACERTWRATMDMIAELMMSNLDVGEALGNGSRTRWRRSTDADDGKVIS